MQDLLQLDHVPDVEQDDEVFEHMRVHGLVPELLISILYIYILLLYIYGIFLYAYLVTCADVLCIYIYIRFIHGQD